MKLKATNNRRISLFLAILLSCLALAFFGAESVRGQARSTDLDVEVVVGYHNYIKYGSHAPVQVKISENHAKRGGTVVLMLEFQEAERYYYTEQYPSGRLETEVTFCVSMPEYYESDAFMEVKILDETGEELYENRVGYQGNDQGAQIYVGVLTDRYEGMDYWDALQLESPYQMGGHTIPLTAKEIPDQSQNLDMLDLILIKDFSDGQLMESQEQALEHWIFDGGVLLVDGSDGFAEETADEENAADDTSVHLFEKLDGGWGNIYVTEYGNGRIVQTDFDTAEFSYRIENEGEGLSASFSETMHADELMDVLMGEGRLEEIYQDGCRGTGRIQEFIHEIVSADGIRIPSFGVYVLILAVYILVLVPVCYLMLRKKGRLEWLRVMIVFMAVLGSGMIFWVGSSTRFSEPFLHFLQVEEYWGERKTETVYAALQAPYNKAYEVSFDPSYEVLPVVDQWGAAKDRERTEEIEEDGEAYRVRLSDTTAFQEEYFRLKKTETDGEKVKTDIHLFEGKTTGTLENGMGETLKDVMLLMPEYALDIGTMEAGETVNLEAMPSISYDSGNLEDMWGFTAQTGLLRKMNQKHLSLIESYLWTSYEKKPCLIGFAEGTEERFQKDSEYTQYGERMVIFYVDVDTTKDGWEYYPTLPMESRIVFGNFYGQNYSTMEGDSGVIAYTLDGEYEIRELEFHMGRKLSQAEKPVTEIYFLNPLTGEYTLVYPGNTVFSGAALQDYINMNEIYIKFRSTAENEETTRLPRISMIGRKRDVGN